MKQFCCLLFLLVLAAAAPVLAEDLELSEGFENSFDTSDEMDLTVGFEEWDGQAFARRVVDDDTAINVEAMDRVERPFRGREVSSHEVDSLECVDVDALNLAEAEREEKFSVELPLRGKADNLLLNSRG